MGAALIRVSQARDTYNREDVQQLIEAIKELQKLHMLLSSYVPQVDVTTGKNVKLQIDNLTPEAVEL